MLENEDIQHILLTRTPALTGRYEFLSFRNAAGGRAWLSAIREKAQSAAEVMASVEKDKRWVTVAFTWNGLRALGVDEGSLATFPEEFKQGMVARAEMLGDTGENHPDNWVGGLASPDLHAIAILFARDAAERSRCQIEHDKLVAQCQGVEVLSTLDLEATPPFEYAHDHPWMLALEALPLYDGIARVKVQAHWQTDVLAGFAIGTAAGYYAHSRDNPFFLEVLPHGVGVGIRKQL